MPSALRHDLIAALPYARRYARALSGDQKSGDALVARTLQNITSCVDDTLSVRENLYRHLTSAFDNQGEQSLTLEQRALLLLTCLEGRSLPVAARILKLDDVYAEGALAAAREILEDAAHTSVLIIEDEPIIAMDIQGLVEQCGHRVVGVAHSEDEAIRIASETKPGLILADINLGIGGDGMYAISRILEAHKTPVIFVTAYPERLLTGESQEPSFVISKPFEPMALSVATYQAIMGSSLVV
ncbi:response regulator [Neokomagataea thailandica]|uniref:Two-component response regulator n=1 Tax=Neokomagataea tanensis NBRC 106556 TaxID=1223519 RepID=A0ABQ0QK78_9PROT|nr:MULTISPECIES: response regulator [Neokomagataea]GBR47730.1 two-component response regulator [Neokomagataea tanensis NBRC 106556]